MPTGRALKEIEEAFLMRSRINGNLRVSLSSRISAILALEAFLMRSRINGNLAAFSSASFSAMSAEAFLMRSRINGNTLGPLPHLGI